jgi:hypothetical protein
MIAYQRADADVDVSLSHVSHRITHHSHSQNVPLDPFRPSSRLGRVRQLMHVHIALVVLTVEYEHE